MQLQFQRRLSAGLQALASYTWSHAIDEVSDEVGGANLARGDSDFDVRHNFSAALSYDLPAPLRGGAARAVLGHWSVDAIAHAQSAYPLTVFARTFFTTTDRQLINVRPNLVKGVPVYISDGNAPGGRRLNRDAFQIPPAGQVGSLGRNTLRGFPLTQFDLSLRRQFPLGERAALQFRADVFNVLNHPNFGPPVSDLTNPLFGQSTQLLSRSLGGLSPIYQIGGPRSIQFSLKFIY